MVDKKSITDKFELDLRVLENFNKVKLWLLIPPSLLLILFFLYFSISQGTNFVDEYVESQKSLFFYINNKLSGYPDLLYNITQLGDVRIFFPFIIVFLFYTPKLWEVLFTSSIITLLVTAILKKYFYVARPAHRYDLESFIIIGETHLGNKSFPSGHSITVFMLITILFFAFMPTRKSYRIVWFLLLITLGFTVSFSRVGVGAHYPFDVIIGMTIGFVAAIIGIKVNNNLSWLDWIKNKKFYPIFIILLLIWIFLIVKEIINHDLPIFYLSLISLIGTLFLITNAYVKKN